MKNNLDGLNEKITTFIDNIDMPPLKLYSQSIKIISEFSKTKIEFPIGSRFADYFSKIFSNSNNNLGEEILHEIKISCQSLSTIYEKKGFIEWFSSFIFDYKRLINFYDIILNTFINKIEYILKSMKEQYENYINNLIDLITFRANSTTIEFTEEQKKIWESLIDVYQDIRSSIIDIKFRLPD